MPWAFSKTRLFYGNCFWEWINFPHSNPNIHTDFLTQLGVKSFFKIFFEGCQGNQLYATNRKRNDLFNCINYFNSLLISIIRKKIGHPKVFHGYVAAMRWQKERFKLRPLVDIFERWKSPADAVHAVVVTDRLGREVREEICNRGTQHVKILWIIFSWRAQWQKMHIDICLIHHCFFSIMRIDLYRSIDCPCSTCFISSIYNLFLDHLLGLSFNFSHGYYF